MFHGRRAPPVARPTADRSSMLDAAALQDHFARSLNLSMAGVRRKKPRPKRVRSSSSSRTTGGGPATGGAVAAEAAPATVNAASSATSNHRQAQRQARPGGHHQSAIVSSRLGRQQARSAEGGSSSSSSSRKRRPWRCLVCTWPNNSKGKRRRKQPGAVAAGDEDGFNQEEGNDVEDEDGQPQQCEVCSSEKLEQFSLSLADPRPALTLAQLRGLVAPPKEPLSDAEWRKVEVLSVQRGDSACPCAICQEPFAMGPQVILSCSHVFHFACITSFERFTAAAAQDAAGGGGGGGGGTTGSSSSDAVRPTHQCPLCRAADYEKRRHLEGARRHVRLSATVLAAAYRGMVARAAFEAQLRAWYASGGGDGGRRRDHFARRLGDVAGRVEAAVAVNEDAVDRLFAEGERAIALSRRVFGSPTAAGTTASGGRHGSGDNLALSAAAEAGWPSGPTGGDGAGGGSLSLLAASAAAGKEDGAADVDWEEVQSRAVERGHTQCSICLSELDDTIGICLPSPSRRSGGGGGKKDADCQGKQQQQQQQQQQHRQTALLSCSHVFHAACIAAFERFAEPSMARPRCPICRCGYHKRVLAGS